MLLSLGLVTACWSQDSQKKIVRSECLKVIRADGSVPKGPFRARFGESYKRSPIVKFLINENGEVTEPTISRSSGIADIDKKLIDAVARWKYKPRPSGCGVIENEMAVTIDLGPLIDVD